ncbi:TPA: hypothetical protein DDZ06_01615 [Candidatus Uhrbacteria bacterium]|uniref:Primosomal protein n n=2 Tax=Candidatus Uhriibacteriota TaxID=1752732 RepID=A0A0G1T6K6_9BACT|nr:MAG: Primosomal protein n [Candidatus Uhrbacteria bacterium GW2011_GWF2_46_218]KKU41010.1 MAG: Primosomal protein n [Candidatus Uhrbacteria bacterium GW2011_GWE2_46_68]HBK33694.1 hypothetical protein [Candidatus Uhrbacteria bacterium]
MRMPSLVARIYPIQRMPRTFGIFDYDVPEGMSVTRGDVVMIPFRKTMICGVIAEIIQATKSSYARKPIRTKIENLHLSQNEIAFFEFLAHDLAQSVPSVLDAALPTPPKRISSRGLTLPSEPLLIPKSEAPIVMEIAKRLATTSQAFVMSPDLRRSASIIAAYAGSQTKRVITVIAPTIKDATLLASHLHHLSPLLLTGEETNASRYRLWSAWRAQTSGMLIGTRLALLHTHPDLSTIFLVRSGHEQHKQSHRNPRYDARQITLQFAKQSHISLYFLDTIPLVDDLEIFSRADVIDLFEKPETRIISLTRSPHQPHPLLAYQTSELMEEMLRQGKQILCVYNKKGMSRQLLCQDCGYDFLCDKCLRPCVPYEQTLHCPVCLSTRPIPMSCPSCKGVRLQPKGFGNRALVQVLKSLFPAATVTRVDSDEPSPAMNASLLLVTDYYLEHFFDAFHPPALGCVIKLDTDLLLTSPSFRATEQAMRSLEDWRGIARACKATFIAQTRHSELMEEWLSHPYRVHQKERSFRLMFGHPPFERWMKVEYKTAKDQNREQALLELQKSLRCLDPAPHIIKRKKGVQFYLEVCCPLSSVPSVLSIFSKLPDAYIIDTNPLF